MTIRRRLTIAIDRAGATTCASHVGVFCSRLRTTDYGTRWLCALFDEEPLVVDGWLHRLPTCLAAEREARSAALEAVFAALPRCQSYGANGDCGRLATRRGACDPHDSYCCDEHRCRHECPELPWAAAVRALEALPR